MNPSTNPRWAPSVTVAAIVEHEGRYLLVQEHTPEGLRLNNPAGHLEPGETLLQAVQREVLEETACQFTPTALLGVMLARFERPARGEDVTYLRFAFTGPVSAPDATRRLDEGIVQSLWLTREELRLRSAEHRSPLVMQCVDAHAAGVSHPLSVLQHHESLWRPWRFG